jgi:hypothetical protein
MRFPLNEHLQLAMYLHLGFGAVVLLATAFGLWWKKRLNFSVWSAALLGLLAAGAVAGLFFVGHEDLWRFVAPLAMWVVIGALWLHANRARERITIPEVLGGSAMGLVVGAFASWYLMLIVAVVRYVESGFG